MILLPTVQRTGCCCQRGISRFCPASPKSAFIKNEQKTKTKTLSFRSKWGRRLTAKKFTADSPPIYRPFDALFYGRAALLPHFFPGLKPRTSCCCQRGISKFYPASPRSAFIKNEQKAKNQNICVPIKGGRRLAAKNSPPIHRSPFAAVSFGPPL
jgi:hypothetical protein